MTPEERRTIEAAREWEAALSADLGERRSYEETRRRALDGKDTGLERCYRAISELREAVRALE